MPPQADHEADGLSTFTELVTLPLCLLYAGSAFAACAVVLLRPLPLPAAPGGVSDGGLSNTGTAATGLLRGLRLGGSAGLLLLAFGTGCDNARTFAGAFESCAGDWLWFTPPPPPLPPLPPPPLPALPLCTDDDAVCLQERSRRSV